MCCLTFYPTNLSPKPVEKKLSYKAVLYYNHLPEHIKWQTPLEFRKQLTLWLQDVFYSKDEFLDKWTQPGTCFDNLPILRKKITIYLSLYKLLSICYNWFVLTNKLFSMYMKKTVYCHYKSTFHNNLSFGYTYRQWHVYILLIILSTDQQHNGSLFTLFLHSPLTAFCFICNILNVPIHHWERCQSFIDRFVTEASRLFGRSRIGKLKHLYTS